MPRVQLTHLCAGLLVSTVGLALVLSSPANAERVHKKQGSYHSQRVAANANARRVKPQGSNAEYIGDAAPRGVPTPIRSFARRFCAMRAASSVESTRRVPTPQA